MSNCANSKEWVPIAAQPFFGKFTRTLAQRGLPFNMPEEKRSWGREKGIPWRRLKRILSSLVPNNAWPTYLVELISFSLKTYHSNTQFHKLEQKLEIQEKFSQRNSYLPTKIVSKVQGIPQHFLVLHQNVVKVTKM